MIGENGRERSKEILNDDEIRRGKSKRSRYVRKAWCVLYNLSLWSIGLIFSIIFSLPYNH